MQRWVTTLIGLAVTLLPVWIVARNFQPPKAIGHDPSPASAMASSELRSALPVAPSGDAGAVDDGGPLLLTDLVAAEPRPDAGVGAAMPDGTPVPALPFTAPRQVRFGVVLVTYTGAQIGPGGPRPSPRSRDEARGLAEKLHAAAEQDFHAAVQQGDAGSSDDVGRVKL